MQHTSPPKRPKTALSTPALAALATAAASTLTAEPALLENIISFIPSSSDATSGIVDSGKPSTVLQTIAVLCRAIPGLTQLVGPKNEAFWRGMVLAHFDFTVGGGIFNVENWGGDFCNNDKSAVDDEHDDEMYSHWHRHPQHGPLDEWAQDHRGERSPDYFLEHSMNRWSSLQAYFKPAAYGFLEEIQQDRLLTAALWPDHEDAFSLFCDLLLLPRFQSNDDVDWQTWSDGEQPVFPCLLGRFPAKIVGRGFAMLKFCDFAPYFWDGNPEPVSKRWSGFDKPEPEVFCKVLAMRLQKKAGREATELNRLGKKRDGDQTTEEEDEEIDEDDSDDEDNDDHSDDEDDDDHSDCEKRTKEERSIFPILAAGHEHHPFQHLRRFVYETFSDWRRVHISQSEMASPEFYIGRTKRSGRWMGFVGQSDYWA